MKRVPIRCAGVLSAAVLAFGGAMRAQAPQAPNSVQVAVPQGNEQDQAAAEQRQLRQQEERDRLAKEPAPRTADGRVVLGNTATLKGVDRKSTRLNSSHSQ